MAQYQKLTDSELDGLLMLGFHPKRKDRASLSQRELFDSTIIPRIDAAKLQGEYADNVAHFLGLTKKMLTSENCFAMMTADMRILKMAALKTYHEFSELLK